MNGEQEQELRGRSGVAVAASAAMDVGHRPRDRARAEDLTVMQTLHLLAAARLAGERFSGELSEMKAGRPGFGCLLLLGNGFLQPQRSVCECNSLHTHRLSICNRWLRSAKRLSPKSISQTVFAVGTTYAMPRI